MEYQINMFDQIEPLTEIEENLKRGSGFEGGKVRIFAAAVNLDQKNFAEYLKHEYGIGGCSTKDGFMDYNSEGITIRKWKEDHKETYNWNEISKKIKKLISTDKYLTDKEKEKIKEIQSKYKNLPCPTARFSYPGG